ncbi:hypothetical protein MSAR_30020 [Mycolicibacterium sarraceniae]|uniref:Uncharacterized protein n=1 Tax=Mycolicibacterium sarraceniae TaxID=1534348 RepID=A0A7I7SVK0_9MYCO|nr:hypothetical protein MSAR_30020 [Mycolicibacterium sarraceniae]
MSLNVRTVSYPSRAAHPTAESTMRSSRCAANTTPPPPYGFHAYPQTAPGHVAAIGYLLGLDDVPDVATARVVEMGAFDHVTRHGFYRSRGRLCWTPRVKPSACRADRGYSPTTLV